MAPVKDAARSSSSRDALRTAARSFLEDSSGLGPPPDGDATPAEISADVLLLVRAMNGQDREDGVAEASTSGRGALDALVGDLLSAQRLHLDQEIASTLAAYYRGVLTDPASLNEDARTTQNSLKTLAQLLQEGGAHLPAQEVDALISALLAKISKKSSNKTGQAGALANEGESSRARGGARDTARHALNALGALVSRASTGCVTTQAHVAVGEAIVSALDAETRGEGVSPEGAPRTMGRARPAEDASSSRFFAAATRCAHVCAGCGVWPERVVSALVTHLRRFFAYGVDKQTNAQTPEHVTNDVPTSPTRGGYVPPHLRTAESSRGYGSSDSDASESDGGRGGRDWRSIRSFEGSSQRRALRLRVGTRQPTEPPRALAQAPAHERRAAAREVTHAHGGAVRTERPVAQGESRGVGGDGAPTRGTRDSDLFRRRGGEVQFQDWRCDPRQLRILVLHAR